ncbi:hypothetical protein [Castellaniella sp.]|uniref:hypothetical protein n=1 Tax=Castellaniella sp. TaxID=1955812 RepID=UPI002AFE0EE6|nr:hypothetical protein [Castellaniella sp.]
MAIAVSGDGAASGVSTWAARLAGADLLILGPATQGSPVLATVRVPVVSPFATGANGGLTLSGAWLGTVLHSGRAESFRLRVLEGNLSVTGTISAPGGGGDMVLENVDLPFGDLLTLSSGLLGVGAGNDSARGPQLALKGAVTSAKPDGQRFKVHWDSWFERPTPAYPEQLYLTSIPAYVGTVTLCFGRPQFLYESLSDNVYATTGLQFDGTGHQLRSALDLLRMRQPHIRIALAIQQGGKLGFEPYDWKGWAGMHSGHLASIRKFVDDMGIREIDVDYEAVSSSMDSDKHCMIQPDGDVRCFTDGELVRVVKAFRDRFPRPQYMLAFDAYNTGAYFGPFGHQKPVGWNHGYVAALAKDPQTRDALDAINIMSFDEQAGYDPVRALEAYSHAFPKAQVYLGLRSGPPWHGSNKMSLLNCLDYINATIGLGTAGIWLYSMLWDLGEPTPPYSVAHPDSNMMAMLAARQFQLPDADKPLVAGLSDRLPALP